MDPLISVSEGHFIGQQVQNCLLKQIAEIADVTVHIDPEDDEQGAPSDRPDRKAIICSLKECWRDLLWLNA